MRFADTAILKVTHRYAEFSLGIETCLPETKGVSHLPSILISVHGRHRRARVGQGVRAGDGSEQSVLAAVTKHNGQGNL